VFGAFAVKGNVEGARPTRRSNMKRAMAMPGDAGCLGRRIIVALAVVAAIGLAGCGSGRFSDGDVYACKFMVGTGQLESTTAGLQPGSKEYKDVEHCMKALSQK
jgi:hypothetical protein